MAVWEFRSVG